jgi:hypothetical protein
MGIVYRARQLSLNRVVALKVFDGSLVHPSEIARFRRAAQAAGRLQHPSIATVHAAGEDDGICYLAMEQIDGASMIGFTVRDDALWRREGLKWEVAGDNRLAVRSRPRVRGSPTPKRKRGVADSLCRTKGGS